LHTQNTILEKLKLSGKLPTPKGLALEIIQLSRRDNISSREIVGLIGADPALGVRILKAASVLLSHGARPVVTVADAVNILGFRALRQLVLGISLVADHQHGSCKQFNYPYFWAHSLLTGIAVRHLAVRARLASAEEIFTLGLLGNIGQLALASIYPNEFGSILEQGKADTLDQLYSREREKFGFEQAEVSAAILADMNFPSIFQRLIHDYPQPKSSSVVEGSREWKLMNLLHIASLFAELFLAKENELPPLVHALRTEAVQLAIEESFILEVADKCAQEWPEWSRLLNLGERKLTSIAALFSQIDLMPDGLPSKPPKNEKSGFKMRVLVVDDDRAMRLLLEKMLKDAGHHVVTASSGVEALQLLNKERPQLIITDWVMPEMDGITLCRELRASPEFENIYVIILTQHDSPDKLVEAFEEGADDFVQKPITPKMFYARLRAAQRVVKLQQASEFERQQLLNYSQELNVANDKLQRQALTDELTGLPNRRSALERLEQEWALTQRGSRQLACLMIDIDRFKSINDRFGHHVGDDALKLVATTLRQGARVQDLVCRYGGEEFIVICPDTGVEEAYQGAERLRLNIEKLTLKVPSGGAIKMTVSIGLAVKGDKTDSLQALQIEADNKLYAAKAAGRNRTVAAR
jgi:diguanylate cyclase (GGDEF)-like protein